MTTPQNELRGRQWTDWANAILRIDHTDVTSFPNNYGGIPKECFRCPGVEAVSMFTALGNIGQAKGLLACPDCEKHALRILAEESSAELLRILYSDLLGTQT